MNSLNSLHWGIFYFTDFNAAHYRNKFLSHSINVVKQGQLKETNEKDKRPVRCLIA